MRDHFIARLLRLAQNDPRIHLITGDLGFRVFDEYREMLPRQFLNAGVAEQNMTGLATGMALDGRIVFTYSIANFPTLRCLEQIRNDACYHNANVKVVSVGGGLSYGALGISHHATEDIAILRALPDITVVAPGDHWEVEEATEAIVNTPGTVYFRLDKSFAERTNTTGEVFELGKARVIRDGGDLTLVAAGGILGCVVNAAETLAARGIECRVLSMHTIKPLDEQAVVAAATESGGIVTVEEHSVDGGLGSSVAEVLLEEGAIPSRFYRIGLRAGFSSIVGSQAFLREQYQIDAPAIVDRVVGLLGTGTRRAENSG